MYSLLQNPS